MSLPHAIESFPSTANRQAISSAQNSRIPPEHHLSNANSNHSPINSDQPFVSLSQEGRRLSQQSDADINLINRATDSQGLPTRGQNSSGLAQNIPLTYQKQPLNQATSSHSLSDEERKEIEQLKKRDLEVKNHERAHASIGGRYTGSPNFQYETGPNGARYAIDGEVSIDLTEVANNPQATIDKMKQVYRAALAPLEPSFQDRSIATQAQQTITTARTELAKEQEEDLKETTQEKTPSTRPLTLSPQAIQNLNQYKQDDNSSKNTIYQLA